MAAIVGGITEIPNFENNREVEDLARFAVQEHNKKENTVLEFVRVVNAKQQVVAGMLYYLTIEATDGGQKKLFEAKVWDKLDNVKEVVEFKPVADVKEVEEFKPVADV